MMITIRRNIVAAIGRRFCVAHTQTSTTNVVSPLVWDLLGSNFGLLQQRQPSQRRYQTKAQPQQQSSDACAIFNHSAATACEGITSFSVGRPRKRTAPVAASSIRWFARSSDPTAGGAGETPTQKAVTFVIKVGHSPEVAKGIVDALIQTGLSGEMLLQMVRSLAGRYEVDEDAGLEALANAVKTQLALEEGKKRVRIQCLPPVAWTRVEDDDDEIDTEKLSKLHSVQMNRAFAVDALEGLSLTDAAKFGTGDGSDVLAEYIECACSGIMACSTCHVVVHPDWFDRVGPPGENEQDMIDLAFEPQPTSRLGCQIELKKDFDGLVIMLPRGANNLMDHIPFED